MLAMQPLDDKAEVPKPRPAATVLLLRDGPGGLEVFMVVRHHQIDFASGALVFPGGSVDAADIRLAEQLAGSAAAQGLDVPALAFRIAGLRETYEECGVLMARPHGQAALIDGQCLQAMRAAGSSTDFHQLLAAEALEPALDLLVPFAHWITPTILPKRFDTHFFIAAAPADQLALHDGAESVDSIWINPAAALAGAASGAYTMVFATRLNVELLGRADTVAAALDAAKRRKIVTVLPQSRKTPEGRELIIPAEAGYGGTVFPLS